MDLSVIIVNWNTRDLLRKCLKSIFEFTKDIQFEVFVVDNASTDGSVEYFGYTRNTRNVHLIANKENLGFAKANNLAAKNAVGKYVLFMNPDMEIRENVFKKMFDFMEAKPDVAISTCKLFYPPANSIGEKSNIEIVSRKAASPSVKTIFGNLGDGIDGGVYPDDSIQSNIKRHPTFLSQALILLKLHHFLPFLPPIKKYLAKDFDYSKEQEVEQIMGAFVFAKREFVEKVGGWDEDYFIWWEDVELCKRAAELGEKIVYFPEARVIHYEGRSFAQVQSVKKQKRFIKSMLIYFKKHHSFLEWFLLWLVSPISLFLAFLVQICKIRPRPQSKT